MDELLLYCEKEILPYMILKKPNKRHGVYYFKHVVEADMKRYVSQQDLQDALAKLGFPESNYYPISEKYFQTRRNHHGKQTR